jgi:hypothetical protein
MAMMPTFAAATDIAKDVIMSTLPTAQTELDQMGRKRLSELLDRIAQIPDEEIPEFPVATDEYKIRMGTQLMETANFCELAQIDFATRGQPVIAAQMTNAFMVTVAEGTKLTGVDPLTEEIVPTQEMIYAHRYIAKMFGCL